jgi:hypothetical protein
LAAISDLMLAWTDAGDGSMDHLSVVPYAGDMADEWDCLVAQSVNGTFLHSRRFLGYHGDRFTDVSVALQAEGRTLAVFPAAVDPTADKRVVSHPGLTYGGMVRARQLSGESIVDSLALLGRHYREQGFAALRYKATPTVFHRVPAEDDSYALHRIGARRYRCDLNSIIDLADFVDRRNANRRRGYKKAVQAGIVVSDDMSHLPQYWEVLEERLTQRHGVRPVHTIDEITMIARLFPDQVALLTGLLEGRVVAGVVLFRLGHAVHIQYSASTEDGRAAAALDPVTWTAIEQARESGARWFSFGISTENEGRALNTSLFRFKESFGGSSIVHEHYDLPLA